MAIFGQFLEKRGILRVNPHFGGFRAFSGPPGQGFYINPSRRGPAVPGAGVGPRRGSEGSPLLLPEEGRPPMGGGSTEPESGLLKVIYCYTRGPNLNGYRD